MNKNTIKIIIGIGALAIAIFAFAIFYYKNNNFSGQKIIGQYDVFAKCLAEKQIAMYGADWCPHCQNEKKAFGVSFQYVPYVECPKNIKVCLDEGVDGYPTWIWPDGKKLVGEQGIEKLSKESGCQL